jgi:1,4-dihydroxy-2-naphthoate octaprenyltransferase
VPSRPARTLLGIYRLADPKIMLASLVPFAAGTAIAHRAGGAIPPGLLGLALGAIFGIEVGKNAVNDFFDFRSGTDPSVRPEERTPFSGGKRVLVEGLLTGGEVLAVAVGGFALALVFGVWLARIADPRFFLLGAAAAVVSIAYTAPPFQLSYHGLGEPAVFVTYGPGIVLGTELLFLGRIEPVAVWTSLSLGVLVANVLLVNELPDERADGEAGKRTWVVRLGRRGAASASRFLFAAAFVLPIVAIAAGQSPRLGGLLLGAPAAAVAARELLGRSALPAIVRAQVATLAAYALAGLGLVLAFCL